jgi:uncharacterized protein (DUF1501 family)
MPTRRQILAGMAVLPLAGMAFPALGAQGDGDRRLVVVVLRGAMDGLSAVPAFGDPDFARLRGPLDLGRPGGEGGVLDLDGTFGLHPRLAGLHRLYGKGELAVIHAVATPYRERSHFSGQDTLENGTSSATGARDGWLARTLPMVTPDDAVAVAESVPYLLRGAAHVTAWTPSRRMPVDEDTMDRLETLYAEDPALSNVLGEALLADSLAGEPEPAQPGAPRRDRFQVQMSAAARFLSQPSGPRIAVLNSVGWDTHINQPGRLERQFTSLDAGIEALRAGLGDAWRRTAVLVVSEFGRTVAINGSRGTDHGTGGAAFLLGGAVNGGRVLADWPGLAQDRLLDGRDLRPTLDLRAVAKGVLHDHLKIAGGALDSRIFPESGSARAVRDLIRA